MWRGYEAAACGCGRDQGCPRANTQKITHRWVGITRCSGQGMTASSGPPAHQCTGHPRQAGGGWQHVSIGHWPPATRQSVQVGAGGRQQVPCIVPRQVGNQKVQFPVAQKVHKHICPALRLQQAKGVHARHGGRSRHSRHSRRWWHRMHLRHARCQRCVVRRARPAGL